MRWTWMCAAGLLGLLAAGGTGAGETPRDGAAALAVIGPDRFLPVCLHYENRARLKPRTGAVEFVTVLAEACRASVGSLGSASIAERATAVVFLQRLEQFRRTIVAMNTERIFGTADPHRLALSGRDGGMGLGVPQVSPAGEFLIAHHMGLVDALDAWLGTGVEFTMAYTADGKDDEDGR